MGDARPYHTIIMHVQYSNDSMC